MRETRLSGSEGGGAPTRSPYPYRANLRAAPGAFSPYPYRFGLRSAVNTAPLPVLRSCAQAGADRIVDGVSHATRVVAIVTNQMVIRLTLPKSSSHSRQKFVRFFRRERFPTVQHAAQGLRRTRPDDDMDVVRHDDPRPQFVALSVEESQRISHEPGNFRLAKETVAVAGVEVGVHAGGMPAEQFLLLRPGEGSFGGQGVLEDLFALPFELLQDVRGQRATGDEMVRRICRRAGILPAGSRGFQPRVSVRSSHNCRNFGQDARRTGRLEARPTSPAGPFSWFLPPIHCARPAASRRAPPAMSPARSTEFHWPTPLPA